MRASSLMLLVVGLSVWARGVDAQDSGLVVGVPDYPPFAMRFADGTFGGIAVDLWRLAAEELNLAYDYAPMPRGQAADALSTGVVDLVLAVDATPAIEARADLSQPLYAATMGVASERASRLLSTARSFASWRFLEIVLVLSALLLAVGALLWLVERRRNEEQFHRSPLRGLGDGFWWAGVTLTTIGYGDKAPITTLGRAIAMLWMLVGLAVSAALTATIVTLADVSEAPAEDLAGREVATVEGSTTALYLERIGATPRLFATAAEALGALEDGAVSVAAAPAPALSHAASEAARGRQVRTTRLDAHYVAIALPEGSDLREPLNRVLLRLLAGESGQGVIERHLPSGGP